MKVLIEEYRYDAADVKDILKGIDALENIEGYVSVNYVGYFYNPYETVKDCVFILPKVLLEEINGEELVFGQFKPENIISIDENCPLSKQQKDFIYEFAVWIYRAIVVFHEDKSNDTSIVYNKKITNIGKGRKRLSNTYLDIILSLIRFSRENQNFFFYILRNIHSGFNKINWTRTIGTSSAIVQNNNPVYLNPINRKRQINFDEELIIIFFSILNYVNEHYGFNAHIDINFELITGAQFQNYLNGRGLIRLRQIKYKYFSDKALRLWELCYAFFDQAKRIVVDTNQRDYLLVKNFYAVFEAIIDDLIGEKRSEIPAGLKDQDDGKRVDHMYTYKGLTTHEEDKPIYYIGDSKYYKRNSSIGKEAVYKQFTYARNVIQWNLNLFMNEDTNDKDLINDKNKFNKVKKLRDDDLTEGYNIIPNFFISATIDKDLSYKDSLQLTQKGTKYFTSRQFDNRLFDRDTLLVCHYDVNFLYVVSLYARNNASQKKSWKKKVRVMFRHEIQRILKKKYDFYAMQAHPQTDAKAYINEHFRDVLGKVYTPFSNKTILSLALDKSDPEGNNATILNQLKKDFYIVPCELGLDPNIKMQEIEKSTYIAQSKEKNVLTALVRKTDKDFEIFEKHNAKQYFMEYIPTSINIMGIKFLLPMVGGEIDGYYKVEKMNFVNLDNGKVGLKMKIGEFTSLGEKKVQIYRIKMQPGELISLNHTFAMYNGKI